MDKVNFKKKETRYIIKQMRNCLSNIEIDVDDNDLTSFQKGWAELHRLNQALLENGMKEIKDDVEGK